MWRAVAWAFGLLFVIFMLTTGKQTYYLAGVYVPLLAAGLVSADRWLHEHPVRLRRLAVATALTTVVPVLVALPVLPSSDIGWTYSLSGASGESVGWPQLVSTVRAGWLSIPATRRASAVIFTADYSEAATINELGRGTGLPTAVSGHNSYWWWGPATREPPRCSRSLPGRTMPATMPPTSAGSLPACGPWPRCPTPTASTTFEWGGHVYLCTGPRHEWGQIWPRLRHYD